MEIGNWESTQDLNGVLREIERLGLERHLHELDAYGFTVVENLIDPETVQTARQAICDICEQQTGRKPDLEKGEEHPNWRFVPYLMPRHEVFQEHHAEREGPGPDQLSGRKERSAVQHGVPLQGTGRRRADSPARRCRAAASVAVVCGDLQHQLRAHGLHEGRRVPGIVPGSHKLCRPPNPEESWLDPERQNPNAVAMEGPAGTAVLWHGNTWHGSFPRLIPGLRLNLAVPYVRPFMKLQERYGSELPQSVIDRNSNHPRFRQLVGLEDSYGWKEEGPNFLDPVNGGFKEEPVNRAANSTHYA